MGEPKAAGANSEVCASALSLHATYRLPPTALWREIHAALQVLEARFGAQAYHVQMRSFQVDTWGASNPASSLIHFAICTFASLLRPLPSVASLLTAYPWHDPQDFGLSASRPPEKPGVESITWPLVKTRS
jgi:hypothetical protein